jgi:hypothetical protein
MKLENLLKTALDELRMQMLGVQVLFGFQFQGVFQEGFDDLSQTGRYVNALGLGLMIVALALLIAAPCQHRIVEHGETTERIHRAATRFSKLALFPLAGGIGCAVFVATSRAFSAATGAALSIATFILAIAGWYGAGLALRRYFKVRKIEGSMEKPSTPLHAKIDQMLTEARVILPGAQALLGFQLVVMMTKAFDHLSQEMRLTHLAALVCIGLAIILLIAPAAVHRISFDGRDDPRLHTVGSVLITVALIPLAIGISCDFFVAMSRLVGQGSVAVAATVASFGLLVGLWYVLPLALKPSARRSLSMR